MSNIDKQALRNLAVAAKLAPSWYAVGEFGDVVDPAKPEWKPVHEFCKTFTAERVLALLDELAFLDKRNAELNSTLERWAVDRAQSASELEEKDRRIAELERERVAMESVTLAMRDDMRTAAAGKGE